MNTISRLITGTLAIVLGLILIIVALAGGWPAIFYGIPILIIGVFILLNKKEDKIEGRKDIKSKRKA